MPRTCRGNTGGARFTNCVILDLEIMVWMSLRFYLLFLVYFFDSTIIAVNVDGSPAMAPQWLVVDSTRL